MELSGSFGCRAGFLWLSFCIFLTLSSAKPENPLTNVNLSPFWQWTSAYECLQNKSIICGANNLNLSGIIVVGSSELTEYCQKGCAQWTRGVLNCIHWVHRDFHFANKANVQQVIDTINNGCKNTTSTNSTTINTTSLPTSSGMRNFNGIYMALFSALVLAIFLFSA